MKGKTAVLLCMGVVLSASLCMGMPRTEAEAAQKKRMGWGRKALSSMGMQRLPRMRKSTAGRRDDGSFPDSG